MDTSSKVLIIGAGAFGTSTAHALSQRGYKNVTVVDKYPVPSIDAAATDISKIIRSDYNVPLYARLGMESMRAWKEPLYRGLYQVSGWILSAKELSVPFVEGSIQTARKLGIEGVERLSKDEIAKRFPVVTGKLDGWNINVWNPTAGWARAGDALQRLAGAAQKNGVEFISGPKGNIQSLEIDSKTGRCIGATALDGTTHRADIVVVAAGAWTPRLIDLQGQLTAKGHSVAHIQLTGEEARHYSKFPLMDNLELGYFFPPNKDNILKLAHSLFITNHLTDPKTGITTSSPHTFVDHPNDDLPTEIINTMRRNLRRVLPELAERPFSFTRLCWDADTADRHFLITPHPEHAGMFIAAGGSAHGFKFMPVIGKYIADLLEGKLEADIASAWRWRPGQQQDSKNLAHMDPDTELRDLSGWKRARGSRRGPNTLEARL